MAIIVRSNIKKLVKDLQQGNEEVTSVAEEVSMALEKKVEDLLVQAIGRAKENRRRTMHARDL